MNAQTRPLSLATAAGVVIALGWPFLHFGPSDMSLANLAGDYIVLIREWAFTIVILAIVIFWERQPLTSIGLRRPNRIDLVAMVAAFFIAIIASSIVATLTEHASNLPNPGTMLAVPWTMRLALTLTAGICEETLLRGYALERLIGILKNPWLAGTIVVLVFGAGHIGRYGFTPALLVPTVIGAVLTALYVWRRNLPICIIVHAAIDAVGLFLMPLAAAH
jgi:membrane protease YdiL (CAAX protease family)